MKIFQKMKFFFVRISGFFRIFAVFSGFLRIFADFNFLSQFFIKKINFLFFFVKQIYIFFFYFWVFLLKAAQKKLFQFSKIPKVNARGRISGFFRFYPDFNFLSQFFLKKDKFFIFIFCKKFIFFSFIFGFFCEI